MKIKICGVRHPEDAFQAAQLSADYIGVIFAAGSRRQVSASQAKEIASAARSGGAEPVGVFVNETAEQIISLCTESTINIVQLHGEGSRAAVALLCMDYSVIYALPGDQASQFVPACSFVLFDGAIAGSGQSFDWENFTPPKNHVWMLAGGLNPHNVATAIRLLKPDGVDISSGVESTCGCRKDLKLVEAFIQNAREAIL